MIASWPYLGQRGHSGWRSSWRQRRGKRFGVGSGQGFPGSWSREWVLGATSKWRPLSHRRRQGDGWRQDGPTGFARARDTVGQARLEENRTGSTVWTQAGEGRGRRRSEDGGLAKSRRREGRQRRRRSRRCRRALRGRGPRVWWAGQRWSMCRSHRRCTRSPQSVTQPCAARRPAAA